ncbi:elongator complex protein 2 [Phlebotomus argentipes]|uniref:elongator complex protein 2 n=1 Tax=Phlebotomus argentipes TaxID=94469 RepID=UPI0028937468|nr:elongator complex protein 2 [Phlebotomus argentipes]
MKIENLYTSAACNRTSGAVDWCISRGIIAFGTCNSVATTKEQQGSWQITQILTGHRGLVNAVKWMQCDQNEDLALMSASDDGTVILWLFRDGEDFPTKVLLESGRKCGICTVDGVKLSGKMTIAAGFKDSFVEVWERREENVCVKETLNLGKGFCLAIRMAQFLNTESLMLLVATSESRVNLYIDSDQEKGKFELKKTLVGHSDWIRGIDTSSDGQQITIATSSQDNNVRLWRVSAFQAPLTNDFDVARTHLERLNFQHCNETYQVVLESVLKSHEGWVYSVQLGRNSAGNLKVLSASIDKSAVIWTQSDGLWLEEVRLGDLGGNQMGFLTAQFGEKCNAVLTQNFQGCLQIWQKLPESENWDVTCTFGGHFGAVREIAWEPLGEYLISVSADQTTRIHGQWKHEDHTTWHEIARPQIHGYDLQAIVPMSRFKFLSAAEEKIIRCFQAPTIFARNFQAICKPTEDEELKSLLSSDVAGVEISALGLSAQTPDTAILTAVLDSPPNEEYLKQNSLWVELQKLYGHGYDVYALAVSPDGKILASSCKASNAEHAKVILWDTSTWHPTQNLHAHQLTVTQIRFSPDNLQLLLVSRDRKFSVFERQSSDAEKFSCTAISDKANGIHTRIIWCCGWSHDSKVFATGSRDGKLVSWRKSGTSNGSLGEFNALATQNFTDESVTALDFAGEFVQEKLFVAVGFESGKIAICSLSDKWEILQIIDNSNAHSLTVKSLRFRPGKPLQFASCGDDHLLRIFNLQCPNEKILY